MSYVNPVWPHSFPDPCVLKFRGEYWGYCTGFWRDGRCFGVIRSRNLVHWEPLAGAMAPLPGGHPRYWAPEVTYDGGRFHLYYSVGDEERMEIRVAVSEHPAGPFADSGRRLTSKPQAPLPILRTIEGTVLGPDHSSVVRGPDNRQLFCVYHRWHEGERVLAIDPLGWEGEKLVIDGPSTDPRPGPPPAAFADFFEKPGGLDLAWDIRGTWSTGGGSARQPLPRASGEARLDARRSTFLVEVSARALEDPAEGSGYGIALPGFVFLVPPRFHPRVWHLIRAEVNEADVRIWLDGLPIWQGTLPQPARSVSLLTDRLAAEFSGFALT